MYIRAQAAQAQKHPTLSLYSVVTKLHHRVTVLGIYSACAVAASDACNNELDGQQRAHTQYT